MIPRIISFTGNTIYEATANYNEAMPLFLSKFESEHGAGIPSIVSVYFAGNEHIIVASIWQDKAKITALEAMNKLQQSGADLIGDASKKLQDLFAAEDRRHEYQAIADENGKERLMCIHCKNPI